MHVSFFAAVCQEEKLEGKVISTLKPSGRELDKVCNSAESW